MKKIKYIALIMSVASSLLMFSVGFSTWYSVDPAVAAALGAAEAFAVEEYSQYISLREFKMFKFSALSFRDDSGAETDTATIEVSYTVNKAALEKTGGEFTADVTLGYHNLSNYAKEDGFAGLFAGLADGTCGKVSATVNSEALTTLNVGNESIDLTYKFEGIDTSKDYDFTVIYTFNIPSKNGNFRQNFGRYINMANIDATHTKFISTAKIVELTQ